MHASIATSAADAADAADLLIDDVVIRYDGKGSGGVVACQNVHFGVSAGEFIVIVGRSGCGKTSLLNAIDGLAPLAGGRILVGGTPVLGPGRDRAMVFQAPTLFPWRSVLGNVKFGAEAFQDRQELDIKARELVKLVGLDGFEHTYPHQLSGGMQQRVNLARALAVDPNVLLLDEPFSALDAQTREQLQAELLRIWAERNGGGWQLTMVFVTHDISEAVFLADRVIVFSSRPGRVQDDIRIDLGRPRDPRIKRAPEFQAYSERIAELLEASA